jgi:hypothetical protein
MKYDIKITPSKAPGMFKARASGYHWWKGGVVREFIGSGTVWHCLPDWERASTKWESDLCDAFVRYKYEQSNG